MDLIQSVATITLMTLLIYFIMVNILEKTSSTKNAIPASGTIGSTGTGAGAEAEAESTKSIKVKVPVALEGLAGYDPSDPSDPSDPQSEVVMTVAPGAEEEAVRSITNKLNLKMGFHDRTTIGGPAPTGGENVTTLSVYNEKQKGVLPSNHDLFEKPADFGSDVTNINQFYKNNPDVFNKSNNYVPDTVSWENQGQELYDNLISDKHQGPINASNFESNPGYDLPNKYVGP